MQRFRRLFGVCLLALLTAVIAWRALQLGRGSLELDGRDERTWFGWAYRKPRIALLYSSLRPRLVPGERLMVEAPASSSPLWAGVMGLYYLPEQLVTGVRALGEPAEADAA